MIVGMPDPEDWHQEYKDVDIEKEAWRRMRGVKTRVEKGDNKKIQLQAIAHFKVWVRMLLTGHLRKYYLEECQQLRKLVERKRK